jgi:hypothetical protein
MEPVSSEFRTTFSSTISRYHVMPELGNEKSERIADHPAGTMPPKLSLRIETGATILSPSGSPLSERARSPFANALLEGPLSFEERDRVR